MSKKSVLEKLALPMFATGTLAMILSASITVSATANASSPVEYKKVTISYLSSGYSSSSSGCGSYQDLYNSNSWNTPTFTARDLPSSNNQKFFTCQATIYVVTGVQMPTPSPVPTVTIIYKTSPPTSNPRPTYTPGPTNTPRPTPSATPTRTPYPVPSWYYKPGPTPTKRTH